MKIWGWPYRVWKNHNSLTFFKPRFYDFSENLVDIDISIKTK